MGWLQKPDSVQSQKLVGGWGGGGRRWAWEVTLGSHSIQRQGGLALTPSDLCVYGLLPTHKGLPEMLPLCLVGPGPVGPGARGQSLAS